MPGNTSNNGSFTDEDEKNLAYMFAQDVRLFIKYLGERCAKDPDNRVKYRWSDKQLEYVRNLYNSASFHQRLCDYLCPDKDKAAQQNKEIKGAPISPSVVDEYVGERYPERASRRGKSASPNRGRGQVTGKSTVGRNLYPHVHNQVTGAHTVGRNPYPQVHDQVTGARTKSTVERNPYPQVHEPSQPTGVADEPLYSSEPLGNSHYPDPLAAQSYNPEQFLTVPETVSGHSWPFTENEPCEPECTFEVIPPSPHLDTLQPVYISRSPSFESGSSTTLVSRETSVELLPYGAVQFPQPQIPQFTSPVGHSWEFPLMTSWNNSPVDQKRKRGHEEREGPAAKKRRT